jgi:hypothetical protein
MVVDPLTVRAKQAVPAGVFGGAGASDGAAEVAAAESKPAEPVLGAAERFKRRKAGDA